MIKNHFISEIQKEIENTLMMNLLFNFRAKVKNLYAGTDGAVQRGIRYRQSIVNIFSFKKEEAPLEQKLVALCSASCFIQKPHLIKIDKTDASSS